MGVWNGSGVRMQTGEPSGVARDLRSSGTSREKQEETVHAAPLVSVGIGPAFPER